MEEGNLQALFDIQIHTLKERGCPQPIIERLQGQRTVVLSSARRIHCGKGHIPFLPVIPCSQLSLCQLIAMVRNGSQQGYVRPRRLRTKNAVETPQDAYYIYGVEDGDMTKGKSPQEAAILLQKQGRRCLTVEEVVALCVHTDVLTRRSVWAAGSQRDEAAGRIPILCLFGEQPRLGWGYAETCYDSWGVASCHPSSGWGQRARSQGHPASPLRG